MMEEVDGLRRMLREQRIPWLTAAKSILGSTKHFTDTGVFLAAVPRNVETRYSDIESSNFHWLRKRKSNKVE